MKSFFTVKNKLTTVVLSYMPVNGIKINQQKKNILQVDRVNFFWGLLELLPFTHYRNKGKGISMLYEGL